MMAPEMMRHFLAGKNNQTALLMNQMYQKVPINHFDSVLFKRSYMVMLEIGQENHCRLLEGLNQLIIDCTI